LDEERITMLHHEMNIPKSRGEIVSTGFLSFIVVSAFLAVLNLANHDAIILSIIWLLLVGWILWSKCQDAGGIRGYLIDWLAVFAGRDFVSVPQEDTHQARIRFGYDLFGRRFYQKDIGFDRIESVEWSTGQATSRAGRDMNDWSVTLWYDHGDSERSKKHHMLRKPDQNIYIVGSSRPKEDTATLGKEFVSFLSGVGVLLVRGEGDNVYVRAPIRTQNIR
jgi:hypothetical protein